MAEPTAPLAPVATTAFAAQRLPRNTIQTVVAPTVRQTSPFTPRDGNVANIWAAPLRSSSVPRVASAQGLAAGPTLFLASGATTPGRPVPVPYTRHAPVAVANVAPRAQFVRLDEGLSGVNGINGVNGVNVSGVSSNAGAATGDVQKVREELEARMAEMQSRWEERFCEAVDFWHQAWSTTTSVVKDCNTHCVKLSEVLEASLDQLGQKSLEVVNLQNRVQLLEAACGQANSPVHKDASSPQTLLSGCSGTSDSFKKLSEELASFADYVSEQSWRMRSDLGRDNSKPQPSSAGALPRPPVEATAMSHSWR